MDTDKIKIFGGRIKVTSPKEMAELEEAEKVPPKYPKLPIPNSHFPQGQNVRKMC